MTRNDPDDYALHATSASGERTRKSAPPTGRAWPGTTEPTPTSAVSGSVLGRSDPAAGSPILPPSGEPSVASTRPYRLPANVREFAAQANMVATDILNGKIDLETARAYSSVARTVAQAITAETTHARFLKTAPDLRFPDMEDDPE